MVSKIEFGSKEYPEQLSHMEMTLVRMLRAQRSWACHMEIIEALQNIQHVAAQMKKEQEHLLPDKHAGEVSGDRK